MKKEKKLSDIKVTVNDVLEALAIRINDVLRPDKKSKNKKNNAYFWAFKLILLLLFIWIIKVVFQCFEESGVMIIYNVSKSLRSVLSTIWVVSLNYIKGILILYLLYDNLKIFVESEYYDNLYENQRKLRYKKEILFKAIELFLKIYAVFFMIGIVAVGLVAIFAFILLLIMVLRNIYIISPLIITGSLVAISILTFFHIKNKFFDDKQYITKNHFLLAFIILIIGVLFFGYETSSYEYMNKLPDDIELVEKEQSFAIKEDQLIKIKSNSKLNNVEIIYDDSLEDEMIIKLEYFETAKVRYYYEFNENDDLILGFSYKLDFKPENVNDVFNMIYSTFNRKIIYNYNLFKYPNIYIHINSIYKDSIKVE